MLIAETFSNQDNQNISSKIVKQGSLLIKTQELLCIDFIQYVYNSY